ncbi:MAG: adenylate kinase [Pseudomonadota bacterium]
MRIALIGNAAGGKSTLSRRLADTHDLPLYEIDKWQWGPGWEPKPEAEYAPLHEAAIEGERWVIDGMGTGPLINARLRRATDIILIDLPIWQHYWLAAERQRRWQDLPPGEHPGGNDIPVSTRDLFEMMHKVATVYLPNVRKWAEDLEGPDTRLHVLHDIEEVGRFELT